MTDISITSPAAGDEPVATADEAAFYVVSRRKLIILFIVTMGLYGLYWFYKNWDQYCEYGSASEDERDAIWPIPRAIFSIFFVHSLFRKVKALGQDSPKVAAWRDDLGAWWFVIVSVTLSITHRLEKNGIGLPLTSFLGYVSLVLLLLAYLKAQSMINASCGDPDGKSNSRLTAANWVWIVIGTLLYLGAFIHGFNSGAADGYASSSSSF
ncbi:MAG: hypothetical protein ACXWC4_25100 [Telluria sp.]